MEITLIRHGRSSHNDERRMAISDFNDWVKKYNRNGIIMNEMCPPETADLANSAAFLYTSDLQRSIESARKINPAANIKADPLFRETELPSAANRLMALKLKPNSWAVLLRILWFLGFSSGCESYREAQIRAKHAALKLITYANEHHAAILVGHGIFNMMIAKELQKMGWKGKRKTGSSHWNAAAYKP